MNLRLLLTSFTSSWFFICTNIYAYGVVKRDLGDIADNILEVELATNSFLQFIFVTSGIGLMAASVYHFKLWSQNRQHRPFSRPVLLLVFGIALIALVYIPMPI